MSEFRVLIFDVDGTIADTERDGHRVSFNMAFEEAGLRARWDVPTYGEYLKIAGGKERIRKMVAAPDFEQPVADVDALVKQLHRRKTDLFMELVASGKLPVRPGIIRIIREARAAGIRLAVASTSNEKSVNTVLEVLLGAELKSWFELVLAGDIVTRKKPDPEIYHLVAEKMHVTPDECLVVEDSRNGLLAAASAGMRCVITTNVYTADEDFTAAELVVDSLGDPGLPAIAVRANPRGLEVGEVLTPQALRPLFTPTETRVSQ